MTFDKLNCILDFGVSNLDYKWKLLNEKIEQKINNIRAYNNEKKKRKKKNGTDS